jgi:hypothetical protein
MPAPDREMNDAGPGVGEPGLLFEIVTTLPLDPV